MGWGDWRVPEINDETEFALQVQALRARQDVQRDPQRVVQQLMQLAREKAELEAVVEKATRHIIELEAAAAVAPPPERRRGASLSLLCWWLAFCFLGITAIGGANLLNLVLLLGLLVFLRPGRR